MLRQNDISYHPSDNYIFTKIQDSPSLICGRDRFGRLILDKCTVICGNHPRHIVYTAKAGSNKWRRTKESIVYNHIEDGVQQETPIEERCMTVVKYPWEDNGLVYCVDINFDNFKTYLSALFCWANVSVGVNFKPNAAKDKHFHDTACVLIKTFFHQIGCKIPNVGSWWTNVFLPKESNPRQINPAIIYHWITINMARRPNGDGVIGGLLDIDMYIEQFLRKSTV